MSLSAALSYYTLFSLAPMLLIVVATASLVWGDTAVRNELFTQIRTLVGPEPASAVQSLMQRVYQPSGNIVATVIGGIVLFIGATTVFTQLQTSLNQIWKVKTKAKSGILKLLRDRVLSFTLILAIGFLLIVSLVVNAAITAAMRYLTGFLPEIWVVVGRVIEVIFSFSVITLLFAMIFKFLPDAKIPWRVVWLGAIITTVLFNLGKYLIGLYLGHSQVASTYGSASAVVILIVWVYYSSLILFLGAEFTQVHSRMTGHDTPPSDYAVKIEHFDHEVPQSA